MLYVKRLTKAFNGKFFKYKAAYQSRLIANEFNFSLKCLLTAENIVENFFNSCKIPALKYNVQIAFPFDEEIKRQSARKNRTEISQMV